MLTKFGFAENQPEVLLFYYYNKEHPGEMHSGAWDRFNNFSIDKEMYDRVQSIFPQMIASNQRKVLLKNYGSLEVDASLPIAEQ